MINVGEDIYSLTAFKRDSHGLMRRMKKSGRPLVLTVKGKAEVIVMDPATYQTFAEYHDTVAGIRSGLAQARKGLGESVDEVFDAIERG